MQHQRIKYRCPLCQHPHALRTCLLFWCMDIPKKLRFVVEYGLWNRCLAQAYSDMCRSRKTCKLCEKYHNTLLHPITGDRVSIKMTTYARVYNCLHQRWDFYVRLIIDLTWKRSTISRYYANSLLALGAVLKLPYSWFGLVQQRRSVSHSSSPHNR